jgi:fused signal recognition particle receptor
MVSIGRIYKGCCNLLTSDLGSCTEDASWLLPLTIASRPNGSFPPKRRSVCPQGLLCELTVEKSAVVVVVEEVEVEEAVVEEVEVLLELVLSVMRRPLSRKNRDVMVVSAAALPAIAASPPVGRPSVAVAVVVVIIEGDVTVVVIKDVVMVVVVVTAAVVAVVVVVPAPDPAPAPAPDPAPAPAAPTPAASSE